MKKILLIAGSDPSGGAGIEGDIKTATALGVYSMTAITALTIQNTMGVVDVLGIDDKLFRQSLDYLLEDIKPNSVKIGLVGNEEKLKISLEKISQNNLKNVVIDTILGATSGSDFTSVDTYLHNADMIGNMKENIALITPNFHEAARFLNKHEPNDYDGANMARELFEIFGVPILVKGGHQKGNPVDYLYDGMKVTAFEGSRIKVNSHHGTGCMLSTAISINLAKNINLIDVIRKSRNLVRWALENPLNIGRGNGPIDFRFPENLI